MGSTIVMCVNARNLLLLLMLAVLPAQAQQHLPNVTLIFLQHYVDQDALKVNARMRIKLSDDMIAAMRHGIPLYFSTRFQLIEQTRLMGILPHERTAASLTQTVQLAWSPFDRRWWLFNQRTRRVASTGTLQEALEILGTFSDTALADMAELHPGIRYVLRLRLQLDRTRLPPPLWLKTWLEPQWRLDSGWIVEPIDERKLWQR